MYDFGLQKKRKQDLHKRIINTARRCSHFLWLKQKDKGWCRPKRLQSFLHQHFKILTHKYRGHTTYLFFPCSTSYGRSHAALKGQLSPHELHINPRMFAQVMQNGHGPVIPATSSYFLSLSFSPFLPLFLSPPLIGYGPRDHAASVTNLKYVDQF